MSGWEPFLGGSEQDYSHIYMLMSKRSSEIGRQTQTYDVSLEKNLSQSLVMFQMVFLRMARLV